MDGAREQAKETELPTLGDPDLDTAIGSFMSSWSKDPDAPKEPSEDEDKKKPAEPEPKEEPEKPEDAEEPSEDEEGETKGEEEGESEEKKYGDDDTYVKITVGEEEHEVPVKDLKRLWGQEAALTRRSQEVAEARKTADTEQAKAVASLNVMLQRATERANQYRQIDFLSVAKDLSSEEINVLRTQAQAAFEEEQFFKQELGGFMQAISTKQAGEAQAEAKACIEQLTDPAGPHYIEGWNQTIYDDLRTFAIEEGLPKEVVNALRVPAAFKLIKMAQQFKAGQKALTKVQKTAKKPPSKIVKASKAPERKSASTNKVDAAMGKLKSSGSTDDAMNAFLARAEAMQ